MATDAKARPRVPAGVEMWKALSFRQAIAKPGKAADQLIAMFQDAADQKWALYAAQMLPSIEKERDEAVAAATALKKKLAKATSRISQMSQRRPAPISEPATTFQGQTHRVIADLLILAETAEPVPKILRRCGYPQLSGHLDTALVRALNSVCLPSKGLHPRPPTAGPSL